VEPRRRCRGYLLGLLGQVERKNGWQLAEYAGDERPDGMQRLLNHYQWDADQVRDDLREYISEHLGEPGGVLIVDDTGFIKKGRCSAGVQRQYTGTSGKIDNCQLGVFLAYASSRGRALADRELYIPKSWFADRERCEAAGIGDDITFATKPALALRMIQRAHAAKMPFGWVSGDEAFGQDPKLRGWLEAEQIAYVLAVGSSHRLPTAAGPMRADALAELVPKAAWERISCGNGAKGPRVYDWALVQTGTDHQLLVRRSIADGELAFYRCHAPAGASLHELVRVAGARWAIEECFQAAKNETGLDEYEVRRYDAWYRHITLSMLAHAWLAAQAAHAAEKGTHHLWTTPADRRDKVLTAG
jgi:SRSO17 transposase